MKIREGFKEWSHDIENDPANRLRFLAFRDFCFDLFEEEYGGIRPRPEEEIDPRSVKEIPPFLCYSQPHAPKIVFIPFIYPLLD